MGKRLSSLRLSLFVREQMFFQIPYWLPLTVRQAGEGGEWQRGTE